MSTPFKDDANEESVIQKYTDNELLQALQGKLIHFASNFQKASLLINLICNNIKVMNLP
jgi:hypothetical protein